MTLKTTNFLTLALEDYRAARLLLRQGLLSQGVALASTAVEKEIKATLALKGYFTKKHLDSGLLTIVARHFPKLASELDSDFIKYLGKSFDLRYAAIDGPGYNIVVNQYRTLVTLDHTMLAIDSGFVIQFNDTQHLTPLQQAINSKDPLVCNDNTAIDSSLLNELSLRQNKMLELRVGKNLETLVVTYETERLNIIGKFCKATDMDFNKPKFQLALG